MTLWICPQCGRHHSEGLCPARTVPKYPPRKLHSMSAALEEWTSVYERNLNEFATETNGVPTLPMIKRAQELADREIRLLYQRA